jgi:hypothetical protein
VYPPIPPLAESFMVHFFWQSIIFSLFDDVKLSSNYFAEYGLCYGGYYFIRRFPPMFIEPDQRLSEHNGLACRHILKAAHPDPALTIAHNEPVEGVLLYHHPQQ